MNLASLISSNYLMYKLIRRNSLHLASQKGDFNLIHFSFLFSSRSVYREVYPDIYFSNDKKKRLKVRLKKEKNENLWKLEEGRTGIKEAIDSFTGQKLVPTRVPLHCLGSSTSKSLLDMRLELWKQLLHGPTIGSGCCCCCCCEAQPSSSSSWSSQQRGLSSD